MDVNCIIIDVITSFKIKEIPGRLEKVGIRPCEGVEASNDGRDEGQSFGLCGEEILITP